MQSFIKSRNYTQLLFICFLLTGIVVRVWQFGQVPGGINQDEAYAGYEAYSLLHYGVDSWGYRFPVYLTAWGSGMNVLNTYLMIPFIALFGLHTWVIRLPQLIVACLSLCAVYGVVKRIVNVQAGLCALFLTAIAPWHIMLSRWGLESNLAPGFVLFGMYFYLRGLERSHYLLLSALMYGLALYCYATIWPIIPIVVAIQLLYSLITGKLKCSWTLLWSGMILAVLALPLLLFLLINYGLFEEIRLPFLSIPKLPMMRASEISFSNIPSNLRNLWYIIHEQSDGLIWNVIDEHGLFYRFSFPFLLVGGFYYVKQTITHWLHKEYAPEFFILLQLAAAVLLGLLIEVNVNRINIIFLPIIILCATGVYYLCSLISTKLLIAAFLLYSGFFISFAVDYFTTYRETISYWFCEGLEDALAEANEQDKDICISSSASYARVLYYSKLPVNEYLDTVLVSNRSAAYITVLSFGRYHFLRGDFSVDPEMVYILDSSTDLAPFEEAGFTLTDHGYYTYAEYSEF